MENNCLKFMDEADHLEKMLSSVGAAYIIPARYNTLLKGGVAVDIGANVGAFALLNHMKFDRIICIEPAQETVDKLLVNLKNSNITNVEVHRLGVSDVSDKILRLCSYTCNHYSGNATTMHIDDRWNYDEYEEVMSISLEDIFKRFDLEKIDYLKVDCESSELPFLMNKDLSKIDYLGIEHHQTDKLEMQELMRYLLKFFVLIEHNDSEYNYKKR